MLKTCKNNTCSNVIERKAHWDYLCSECVKKRQERRAFTASLPKCFCGNIIGLNRQEEGLETCAAHPEEIEDING